MKNCRDLMFNCLLTSVLFIPMLICITGCNSGPGSKEGEIRRTKKIDSAKHSTIKAEMPEEQLNSVEAIQAAYAKVVAMQEAGFLDSAVFKYSCNGEKSGTISYFTERGRLRLIEHRYNEYDHFSATDRYYVKDSTLFFAYTSSVTWAFENGPEGATKDNIKERRIYLVDESPIKCLEKRFVIHSHATDNPSSAREPNREIDCPPVEIVRKPYLQLMRFRDKPQKGCLD